MAPSQSDLHIANFKLKYMKIFYLWNSRPDHCSPASLVLHCWVDTTWSVLINTFTEEKKKVMWLFQNLHFLLVVSSGQYKWSCRLCWKCCLVYMKKNSRKVNSNNHHVVNCRQVSVNVFLCMFVHKVQHPCSDSTHVNAPYKLLFYYYYFYYYKFYYGVNVTAVLKLDVWSARNKVVFPTALKLLHYCNNGGLKYS